MSDIGIGERIALMRRQNGLTQEELASALGVTNQAVSKWELSQCCPDIQLLPEIAGLFGVSVDRLLGCETAPTQDNAEYQDLIDRLDTREALEYAFKTAAAMHAAAVSKIMTAEPNVNPGWDAQSVVEHARNGEWGYSSCETSEYVTIMRRGTVLFSNSGCPTLQKTDLSRIAYVTDIFADMSNLRTAEGLCRLTSHDEKAYAGLNKISEAAGLPDERVRVCLEGELSAYVLKDERTETVYRANEALAGIITVLSLLVY